VTIECPVSTRAALDAGVVIGPFAVDVPVRFDRLRLMTLPEAALDASRQIVRLLDNRVASTTDIHTVPGPIEYAFTYQDRLVTLGFPWLRGRADKAVLHACPLWVSLKLSARRCGSCLDLRVSWDPARFCEGDVDRILTGLRNTLNQAHEAP